MAPGNTTQEGCHFIDGLLAVPIEQLGAAMEATGANQSDRVFELLEGVDNAEAVAATIGLLDVDDPHVGGHRANPGCSFRRSHHSTPFEFDAQTRLKCRPRGGGEHGFEVLPVAIRHD